MKKKLILLGIVLVACASTCSIALLAKNKYEKPIPVVKSQITKTVCGEPKETYKFGNVSFYNREYCEKYNPSCTTASGEIFYDTALTAACSYDYELDTRLRITYGDNSVVVRCNDRGNFESQGRTLDLSQTAFEKLAPKSKGVLRVKIEIVYQEYEQLNQYRANRGLSKLQRSVELETSAYYSAKAIYTGERTWSHDGYEKYFDKYYSGWHHIGENLARDYPNFDSVIYGWHTSTTGHRENMQSEEFCEMGIGIYKNITVLHLGKK